MTRPGRYGARAARLLRRRLAPGDVRTLAGATPPRFSDGVDAIDRAAESPYELGAIPLRVADLTFGEAATDTAVVMLVVEADLRAFEFARAGGKLSDVLDLRMLTTELGTNATERYERKVEMSFPEATRFGAESWHPLSQEFHLKPGRYQARVAVRDANSGRIGSVTHDFEVPPLTGLRADHADPHRRDRGAVVRLAGAAEAGAGRAARLPCRRDALLPVQRAGRGQGRRRRTASSGRTS